MRRMRIALIIAGLFLAPIFSLPSFADDVPILSIAPSSSTVGAGSNVVLDVNIANVTDLFELCAWNRLRRFHRRRSVLGWRWNNGVHPGDH